MIPVVNSSSFSKLPLRRVLLPSLTHSNHQVRQHNHHQALPQLPVPPLNQTMDKYLKTIKPLVTETNFNQTKELVNDFKIPGGKGEQLQTILEERAKSTNNWLSAWWLEHAYLRSRSPVVVHYSPSVSFPRYEFNGIEGQVKHASKVVSAILDYKINLDNRSVPVEHMGKAELCMEQYYKLLSTCRIPKSPMDELSFHGKDGKAPGHITVVHNNQFFELKCYRHDGHVLTMGELQSQLDRIVHASPDQSIPIGILTTADRDSWAKIYSKLSATNPDTLQSIESSIFVLCLDGMPKIIEDKFEWRSDFALRSLHGGGSSLSSGNRWFDKTIQMIVDQNGGVGLAYEHSPAEGPPVAAMLDYVYSYCENPPSERRDSVYDLPPPHKLNFDYDDEIFQAIDNASSQLDHLVSRLNLTVREFNGFGKNLVKSYKISPDSFIQMAMQLAYFRLHHSAPATYESGSLRQFVLGRTDTIRSCSIVSDKYVRAMTGGKHTKQELRKLMFDAINEHRNCVMDALSGNGIDRHLLGMKLAALEKGEEVPEIFNDLSYQRAMQFNLSTSQVSCKADLCMAFGPALNEGYGICYNPKQNKLFFSVSSFENPDYEVQRFGDELISAMNDMKDLLLSAGSKL